MKRFHLIAAALLAVAAVIVGCGGSGTTTPPPGDLPSTPRVEAVVRVDRSNLKDPSKYTDAQLSNPLSVDPDDLINPTLYGVQDPRNIQTGESYVFQLVRYEGNNRIIIDDNVSWQTSNTTGIYGNIGSNSGLFLAGDSVNQDPQYIFAFRNGTRYEAEYNIKPRQARLIGRVREEGTGRPIPGVELFFYDNFNNLVGIVTSAYDGSFRASVPTNASFVSPTIASVPVEYYQSFSFDGLRYTVGVPGCKAPLPTLDPGATVLDKAILLTPRVEGQPTPDPTGCTL